MCIISSSAHKPDDKEIWQMKKLEIVVVSILPVPWVQISSQLKKIDTKIGNTRPFWNTTDDEAGFSGTYPTNTMSIHLPSLGLENRQKNRKY